MINILEIGAIVGGIMLCISVFYFLIILIFYKKPNQGEAIYRYGLGEEKVAYDKGIFVIPKIHFYQKIDLTVKRIVIQRTGNDAVICKNYERVELKVDFFFRVNRTSKDILKVARYIGSERTWKTEVVQLLFEAKCIEYIKSVGHQFSSDELLAHQLQFRNRLMEELRSEQNGYILDGCTAYDLKKIST